MTKRIARETKRVGEREGRTDSVGGAPAIQLLHAGQLEGNALEVGGLLLHFHRGDDQCQQVPLGVGLLQLRHQTPAHASVARQEGQRYRACRIAVDVFVKRMATATVAMTVVVAIMVMVTVTVDS